MIQVKDRRLRAPTRLEVNGIVVSLSVGFNARQFYQRIAPQTDQWRQIVDSLAYTGRDTVVMVSLDEASNHGLLLHASISHPDRDPTWDTIRALKEVVFGDTDVMMVLPKSSHYVNLHQHAFHLWAMPAAWDIE